MLCPGTQTRRGRARAVEGRREPAQTGQLAICARTEFATCPVFGGPAVAQGDTRYGVDAPAESKSLCNIIVPIRSLR